MAEGGEDKNQNPYLFQNFVKLKSPTDAGEGSVTSGEDTAFEGDCSVADKEEPFKLESEKTSSKREDNLFSMKQFLRRDDGTKPKNLPPLETNGFATHASNYKENSPLTPTTSSKLQGCAGGLPDFVQDHFYLELSLRDVSPCSRENHLMNVDALPDFALIVPPLAEGKCSKKRNKIENQPMTNKTSSPNISSPNKTKNRNFNSKVGDSIISSSLPDFLSHGPLLSNHLSDAVDDDEDSAAKSPARLEAAAFSHSDAEILKFQVENEALKKQLSQTQDILAAANSRIKRLTVELRGCSNAEQEELNTLEKIVQQVEHNLETTSQRALSAEAMVTKHKQEIKELQDKLLLVEKENAALKDHNDHVQMVKDRACHTSQQINTAAGNAEQLLRQLLSGVDSLKLLASYLNEIDKVTENDDADDDEDDEDEEDDAT